MFASPFLMKKEKIKVYGIRDRDYGILQLPTLRRTQKEVMEEYHISKSRVVSCEIIILTP